MKKTFSVAVLFFLGVGFALAQDNPYAIFGYKVKTVLRDEPEHLKVFNKDTSSVVGAFVFDASARSMLLYSRKGELLKMVKIESNEIFRFISPDPLAEKFYGSSPYNYTDNNPVSRTDPDGRDWTIGVSQDKNGNTVYNVTITGVVYNNSSNRDINLGALTSSITKQIQNAFNFQGQGYSVVTNVNLRGVESADDISKTDHVFQVVDQKYLGGNVARAELNGLNTNIGSDRVGDIISGSNTRTIPHELGHTAGWNHPHGDRTTDAQPRTPFEEMTGRDISSNLMSQTWAVQQMNANPSMNQATDITKRQMELLYYNQASGNLNRNSPVTTSYGFGLVRTSNLLPPMVLPTLYNSVRR